MAYSLKSIFAGAIKDTAKVAYRHFLFLSAVGFLLACLSYIYRDLVHHNLVDLFAGNEWGYYLVKFLSYMIFDLIIAVPMVVAISQSFRIDAGKKLAEKFELWSEDLAEKGAKLLLVMVMYFAMIIAGLCLFVVPGFYMQLRYLFAPIIYLNEGLPIEQCFVKSSNLMHGLKFRVFLLQVVLLVPVSLVVWLIDHLSMYASYMSDGLFQLLYSHEFYIEKVIAVYLITLVYFFNIIATAIYFYLERVEK
jgi:hypothetical protein